MKSIHFRERFLAAKQDILAGFLVFLIALPLCLGVAKASSFPPIAGIWTAVLGGLLTVWISPAALTIKGPAAGLIVIVAGSVVELGDHFAPHASPDDRLQLGYHLALGIGFVAGIAQVVVGWLRLGKWFEIVPSSAVHGLLASIGVIIFAKQAYVLLGIEAPAESTPLELLVGLPAATGSLNPEIAAIGLLSLTLLVALAAFPRKWVRNVPAPILILAVAMFMGLYFDLDHRHTYPFDLGFFHKDYEVGPTFLVDMPNVLDRPMAAFAFPDFRAITTFVGWKFILLYTLIGSLESALSAKAIDILDPRQRKTELNRDLLAVGFANTIAASIGALPMISEIVRSSANIQAGGQTRFANFFHGAFMLTFVLAVPWLIHEIPLAALAAMLVFTGFRLASPHVWMQTWRIGTDQLLVFLATMLATLSTDLLLGILMGIAVKSILHLFRGVHPRNFIAPQWDFTSSENRPNAPMVLRIREGLVFSNWSRLQSQLERLLAEGDVVLDFSTARIVDHTVMEKLHQFQHAYREPGHQLDIRGLDTLVPVSTHPHSFRRSPPRSPRNEP